MALMVIWEKKSHVMFEMGRGRRVNDDKRTRHDQIIMRSYGGQTVRE